MKKSFLLFLVSIYSISLVAQSSGDSLLQPTDSQKRVQQFVSQFLNSYHYKKFKMDDELSSQIFDNYLENLDGGKNYFTQSQINEFEKYRYELDDAIQAGDLTAAYEIFNVYRNEYLKRNRKIQEKLKGELDFYSNQQYTVEEEEDWSLNEQELDEEWDKMLLSQALNMKLSGKSDSAINATLASRYELYEKRVEKWKSEDVFQSFMNSFTQTLDPHTAYMIPRNASQFNIDMSQSLEGIGAVLVNENDYVMIKEIVPGGPLFKTHEANKDEYILGVAQGDDGEFQDIIGWLTSEAVEIIRGKKGSVVRLKLLPNDAPVGTEPRIVRIVREKIKLEEAVATSEIMETSHGKRVGLIDIPMFYRDFAMAQKGGDFQSTTRDVKRFIEEFKDENVDAVVIDLRNNGGGSLTEAIDLSGLFIPDGPVVQRKRGQGKVRQEFDSDDSIVYGGPLVVLQNRFSASASEIFAGAIQDYNRGLVVGEQSFGKGTVQQLVDLDQFLLSPKVASRNKTNNVGFEDKERFGQLKLTTEKFYRISGESTQRRGVVPDVTFPSPFDAEETGESSRPSALEYDTVEPAKYEKVVEISSKARSKTIQAHNERLTSDEDLIKLNEEIVVYNKLKERNTFSLNYDVRMEERKQNEKNRNAMKMLQKSEMGDDDRSHDVYLMEALRIAEDLTKYWKS